MAARFLVVNGWSNAGKTSFCEWLAKERGFDHVDCDKDGIKKSGLRSSWNKVEQGDATALRDEPQGRPKSTVIDWPYNPPWDLTLVVTLQNAGIPVWWFDADPQAAQKSFDERGEGNPQDFAAHSQANQQWRTAVARIYGERHLRTLHADGSRLSREQVWTTICAREGWQP
jgi:hypothetical protein